jgi:hypothetical protein
MAFIKKRNARKELVRDVPMPSVSYWSGDGGLRFNMDIGDYKVSLTHMERDVIIKRWEAQQAERD